MCNQSAKFFKCGSCTVVNAVPGSNPRDFENVKIQNLKKMKLIKCNSCNASLKSYENVLVVKCPHCFALVKVLNH